MTPVEYRRAQSNRSDGFNYFYNPETATYNLGLLIYVIGKSTDDIYRHNRWDVEVEAIPGAANPKLYVRPTADPSAWVQGQLKILTKEEGSSNEVETVFSYTDFQSAENNAVLVGDFTGTTKAKKFKIIILEDFVEG